MILLGNMFLSGWDGGQDIFLAEFDIDSESIDIEPFRFVRRIDGTIRRTGPEFGRWLDWWQSRKPALDGRVENRGDYVAVRFIQLQYDYYGLGWSYIHIERDRISFILTEDRTQAETTADEQAAYIAERNRQMQEKFERCEHSPSPEPREVQELAPSTDRALLVKIRNEYRNVIS